MKRKIRVKGKKALNRFKSKHTSNNAPDSRRITILRKSRIKKHKKVTAFTMTNSNKIKQEKKKDNKKIVRIMGHGQFTIDKNILKELDNIDRSLVEIVSRERSDDTEFKKKLIELNEIVVRNGRQLDPREITRSDIILPSADLSIDEAKKLFSGEGVIPAV
jgi:hypothetical protein